VTPDVRQSVIVLGAGPAGLTAAYRLAVSGCQVTLLSSSSLPGQQLRRAGDPPSTILGCHHATWDLLRALGVQRSPSAFAEATLEFLLPDGRFVRYPKTWFPTPRSPITWPCGSPSGTRAAYTRASPARPTS